MEHTMYALSPKTERISVERGLTTLRQYPLLLSVVQPFRGWGFSALGQIDSSGLAGLVKFLNGVK